MSSHTFSKKVQSLRITNIVIGFVAERIPATGFFLDPTRRIHAEEQMRGKIDCTQWFQRCKDERMQYRIRITVKEGNRNKTEKEMRYRGSL